MRIFLSYPHEYVRDAEGAAVRLRAAGHKVFFADELIPGTSYDERIRKSILNSDLVLFLVGPAFFSAGRYTLTELEITRNRWASPDRHVVPVLLRPMPITELPPYLRAVTVLEPKGDPAAEIVACVRAISDADRKKFIIGFPAALLVLIVVSLASWAYFTDRAGPSRTQGHDAQMTASASTAAAPAAAPAPVEIKPTGIPAKRPSVEPALQSGTDSFVITEQIANLPADSLSKPFTNEINGPATFCGLGSFTIRNMSLNKIELRACVPETDNCGTLAGMDPGERRSLSVENFNEGPLDLYDADKRFVIPIVILRKCPKSP